MDEVLITADEWFASMRKHAGPPSSDDVCITYDGSRLDTPEAVRAWVAEFNALVAETAAGTAVDGK